MTRSPAPQTTEVGLTTPITTIIMQHPKAGEVERFENWLREIVPMAQKFSGHRGVNIIRPHGTTLHYTIILHFDSETHLRQWLDSKTRINLINKIKPYLQTEEHIEITSGLEFWFTPGPAQKIAPRYKQFLITLSAIFPLTVLVPLILNRIINFSNLPLAGKFISAVVIVSLMVYVIMPRYTRLVSRWLYR